MTMTEIRQPKERDVVIYVDPRAKRHPALLTSVHDSGCTAETEEEYPSVNLVYVGDDVSKHDPYGTQIERETSVVHRAHQSAHGNYWEFPGEGDLS